MENYRLLKNYVLVLPDDDYETFQLNGHETGIYTSLATDQVGQRVAVSGTVISVAEELTYLGKELLKHQLSGISSEDLTLVTDIIRNDSVLYDVPIETKAGDKVMFFYKNQIDCYREGRTVMMDVNGSTKFAFLMKYDGLNAVILGEDKLKPLNGYLFVEKVELKSQKFTESGLELVEADFMGMKKKKGFAIGRIVEVGSECRGYLEFPSVRPDGYNYSPGDYVYYDERFTHNLQHENHQTHKTARVILKRKDVHGIVIHPSKLEFA